MRSQPFDVLVLGAGIVGAACAAEFTRSGLRVAICEADGIGSGATGAAMGHVAVMDDSEEQFVLTRYSQSLWHLLAPELPPDAEFSPRGAIWIAADAQEMAEVRRKHGFYSAHGVPAEILSGKQLAEAEPNLRPGLAGGLLLPRDSICSPVGAARYLISKALQEGAVLYESARVTEITDTGIRLENGEIISSEFVVAAAGTQTAKLIPGLPIRARKGHLAITDRCPGFANHQLIELGYLKSAHVMQADSVAFNVQPRAGGELLVGSSRQFGGESSTVEQRILQQIFQRAAEYMPSLPQLSIVRSWTGLRAATPDKLPLIGPWPRRPSVYLATGHEGLGISTSLATARLLADQILNRPSEIPYQPYLPERISVL